ncbi:hypothetical protein ASG43_17360 [Aureimonas sp. Leaf454]|nr:hypothetical protein ASG43_17360 [Aureimonas sp. Leaf454]
MIVPSVTLIVVGLVSLAAYAGWSRGNTLQAMFRNKVEITASLARLGAETALWQFDREIAQQTFAPAAAEADFRAALILDDKGKAFFTIGEPAAVQAAMDGASGPGEAADSTSLQRVVVPLVHSEGGKEMPTGTMVLAFDDETLVRDTRDSLIALGLISLGVTAVSILALFLLLSRITGPIGQLVDIMRRMAGGGLDVTIPHQSRSDEVGAMAQALQVFKTGALDQRRLEAETAETRSAQTATLHRQAAIENAKAEDLKLFVHHVEIGFDRLSSGDLTVRMEQAVAPEFEAIREKFNRSVQALEQTIGSVVGAVGSMRVGINGITDAASDLSRRTEQQAANLEETVAALSDIARGVTLTAKNADDARGAAASAQDEAGKGGVIVARAVAAMTEIEASSEKIWSIIGVIDEIAFQTNLLALNAGVEAARAGDAGRGFAVVAQEVRGLAQRSAEAAREIKQLISTSSNQVKEGVELVSASGLSLEQIVSQVGGVASLISQMASAAREQAVGLRDVSVAADQMDKVTQQNAAMVEETTAAAQSLASETDGLAGLVAQFRTGAMGKAPRSAVAALPSTSKPAAPRPVARRRATGTGGAAPERADEWAEF